MIMKIRRFQQILPGFEHSGDGCSHVDTAGLAKLLHGGHRFNGDAFGSAQVLYRSCNMFIRILGDQDSCGLIPVMAFGTASHRQQPANRSLRLRETSDTSKRHTTPL